MAAYTSLADYIAALKAPKYYLPGFINLNVTSPSGPGQSSMWQNGGGANPGGNAAPTAATAGAIGSNVIETGGSLFIGAVELNTMRKDLWWCLTLADRLVHTSGLSGTAAGAQTTNLPTTALTRATTGKDVRAAVEIYTAVGSTAQTFTCSYTNQAGTPGRTSDASVIGTAGNQAFISPGSLIPLSLQSGDTGVRSVESLTLSGSTTTVGDFGITLYRPLLMIYGFGDLTGGHGFWCPLLGPSGCSLPQIDSNACLFWIANQAGNTPGTSTIMNTNLRLVRG